jgi:glycosyltransferase involved in cell wall biosynthesis
MKKILFFETKEFTGATRVTRTLAKAAAKEYQVAFAQVGDNVKEEIESALFREKPDILFSSFVTINPDVISIGKAKALEVVIRTDYKFADLSEELNNRIIETYPEADVLIAQTVEMADDIKRIKAVQSERVRIVENPIDREDILLKASGPNPFANNGKFHFLWVGRKCPIKDLSTLKAAFDIVLKQNPDTDLTLVSNDPNPYRWIKNADCLVISSISEASPNVLLEALFLGVRVISTDCSPTVRKKLNAKDIVPIADPIALSCRMLSILPNH